MGFRDWLGWRRKEPPMPATLHCTFCGRSGLEAEKIIWNAAADRRDTDTDREDADHGRGVARRPQKRAQGDAYLPPESFHSGTSPGPSALTSPRCRRSG